MPIMDNEFAKEKLIAADKAAFDMYNSGKISSAQYAECIAIMDSEYNSVDKTFLSNASQYAEYTEYVSNNYDKFLSEYDYYREADEAGFFEYNSAILFGCSESYAQKSASYVRHNQLRWMTIYRLMPNKIVFFKK
jgi:hypothetical protein